MKELTASKITRMWADNDKGQNKYNELFRQLYEIWVEGIRSINWDDTL
jgi:hypothetical protein